MNKIPTWLLQELFHFLLQLLPELPRWLGF